ncbi:hypothetical protein Droror1_Dr00004668 [Drosera rotundifolia]
MKKTTPFHVLTLQLLLLRLLAAAALSPDLLLPPSDAVALLSFASAADLHDTLLYSLHERFDYCDWQGVTCDDSSRVVSFSLPSHSLRGSFPPRSLSLLSRLRSLNLRNNSLSGPIPTDLSSLSQLRLLDLAFNEFKGSIPVGIGRLDRLEYLGLEVNRLGGNLPPIEISGLRFYNVSGNNLTGEVPATKMMERFNASSFLENPYLCGEIVNRSCVDRRSEESPNITAPPPDFISGDTEPVIAVSSSKRKRVWRAAVVAVFCVVGLMLVASALLCVVSRMRRSRNGTETESASKTAAVDGTEEAAAMPIPAPEKQNKDYNNLVFCEGEEEMFSVEQLMRSTAEILGRGTIGATYKARIDNGLILTVKRMERGRIDGGIFERHMEEVGALRHPNLVPVRAFFKGKGGTELLVVYDYLRNGSVLNLIHGSRSTRAKPLHWTSCLKIAEDVAQGLAYIHQASKHIHGNLKASNVLLGADFEACVTDYCLAPLVISSNHEDPISTRYQAPETRKSSSSATAKSDVYSFGVLLLELLSGKSPSELPFLTPPDLPEWVRTMRGESSDEDNHRLDMLIEVASVCSVTIPEQRPSMSQVLKMIQNIKTNIVTDSLTVPTGRSSVI